MRRSLGLRLAKYIHLESETHTHKCLTIISQTKPTINVTEIKKILLRNEFRRTYLCTMQTKLVYEISLPTSFLNTSLKRTHLRTGTYSYKAFLYATIWLTAKWISLHSVETRAQVCCNRSCGVSFRNFSLHRK